MQNIQNTQANMQENMQTICIQYADNLNLNTNMQNKLNISNVQGTSMRKNMQNNNIMDLIQGNWPVWLGLKKRSF